MLDRVHLRRNDAGRADVERAFDVHLIARRQADDTRRGAAACISACICAVSSGECSASMNSQSKPTRRAARPRQVEIQCDERRHQPLTRPQSRANDEGSEDIHI